MIVHRFPIKVEAGFTAIEVPIGSAVVSFGWQESRKEFSVWILLDPEETAMGEERLFAVVGTGHRFKHLAGHRTVPIGSVVMPDGHNVFHCFEFVPG